MPSITDPNHHWLWQTNRSICAALWHSASWWGPRAKRFTQPCCNCSFIFLSLYCRSSRPRFVMLCSSGHLLIHLTIAIKKHFLKCYVLLGNNDILVDNAFAIFTRTHTDTGYSGSKTLWDHHGSTTMVKWDLTRNVFHKTHLPGFENYKT